MSARRVSAAPAVALLVGSLIAPAAAAPAAVRAVAPADGCVPPGASGTLRSWATDLLAPTRAWPLSTGSGVRIAVLDSGVDAHQPLLRGRVLAGYDAIGAGAGDTDCLGTGTQVASTIVGTGAGVAPAARIIPVRVVGEPGP